MAFTVTEIFDGGRKMRIDTALVRTYTRRFQVYTDVMNADPNEVWFYSGIPTLYAYYSTSRVTDLGAIIVDYEVEQDSSDPFNWFVTVGYSSKGPDPAQQTAGLGAGSSGTSPPNEPPLADPPQVSWSSVFDQVVLAVDRGSTPLNVQNSAGDPFSPRPTVESPRLRLTFTRSEAAFDEVERLTYVKKLNSGIYRSWPVGTVLIDNITAQRAFKNNIPYWLVTYILDFNPDGWGLSLRNRGPGFLGTASTFSTKRTCVNSGMAFTEVDLNTDGTINTTGTPNYLDFVKYESVDFTPLALNF